MFPVRRQARDGTVMRRPLLTLLAAACALGAGLAAAAAQGFQTAAPHAILIDADSGSVLFEKAADERFSPASMAKLMTTDIVFEALKSGRLSMDTEFTVTEDAWSSQAPWMVTRVPTGPEAGVKFWMAGCAALWARRTP